MNYAILRTGSKQYRVRPGDVIDVEKLPVDEGSSMELTEVLAVSRDGETVVGDPLVPNASVLAQVRAQGKDDKVIVFKYKRKVRYRRKKGHRQHYTRLAIAAIFLDGEDISIQAALEDGTAVGDEIAEEAEGAALEPVADVEDEVADETPEASVAVATEQVVDASSDVPVDQLEALDAVAEEPEAIATDQVEDQVDDGTGDAPGEDLAAEAKENGT